jgi:D-alanyl-D-alanine carboxypeptidase/D-alanyl-D-alanine-endopeptidase (penicillin-binding protein 4)
MARAAAGTTPTCAGSIEELRTQIHVHISQPRFTGALWSVKIASLDAGKLVFEEHSTRLMSPASNCKLYVGALALDHFGGDHRISTPVFATSAPDQTGRVVGDLIVSGRGDPSWKARPRRSDFWSAFEPFVTILKSAGVRHITGDVIADTTFFRSPPYGAGWVIEDLNDDYGAEISAITLEENYVDLRVTPSSVVGRACEFELMQPHSGLVFHNRTVTTPKGGARSIQARP